MANAIWLALIASCAASPYGLLALWVVRGRGPWFVRAAVMGGAIGILIPVPAYDLAIVFLSESLAIIAPLWLLAALRTARRRTAADESPCREENDGGYRFSLTDLFLFTLFAAGIASLGAYLPAKHRDFWMSYALIGVGAGVVNLAAAWAALGRRWLILRWGLLLAVAPGVGYVLGFVELPKELDAALFSMDYYVNFEPGSPEWFSLASVCLSAAAIATWLALLSSSGWLALFKRSDSPNSLADPSRWRRRARQTVRIGVLLLALTESVFFAVAYIKILFPLPIPHIETPEPNGYLVLAKLGGELEQADILTLEPPSETQIRDFVAANRQRLKEARAALEFPHVAPVDYESPELDWLDSLQNLRQLARGLAALGNAESFDGRTDAAAANFLDGTRLGQIARRGGLLVHALVGNAIEGIGLSGLSGVRQSVSPETARQLIAALQRLEAKREPFEAVEKREAAWQQHAYGWAGRLILDSSPEDAGRNSADATSARMRLLICDLAIRLYQAEHGKLPDRLEQLAPRYLRELPIDPFSGRPLAYCASGEEYVLYSLGPDRKDDGGRPTENNFPVGAGDLVLDP